MQAQVREFGMELVVLPEADFEDLTKSGDRSEDALVDQQSVEERIYAIREKTGSEVQHLHLLILKHNNDLLEREAKQGVARQEKQTTEEEEKLKALET